MKNNKQTNQLQKIYDRLEVINPDNEKDEDKATRRIDVLEDMLDIMNER